MKKIFLVIVACWSLCFTQLQAKQTPSQPLLSDNQAVQTAKIGTVFLDKEAATQALATKDDYLNSLSRFDWQAKFKSDSQLSVDKLHTHYDRYTLNWSAQDKQKISTAVERLNQKTAELGLLYSKPLKFIITNGGEEGGAAYTRSDYIVLPKDFFSTGQAFINRVVAHEFFHVYSRQHKAYRDKLYATIHYRPTQSLKLPQQLADRLIGNPDAPQINYYINLNYKGKTYDFMPVILADRPYDKNTNQSFFAYLNSGLIAVKNVGDKPSPLLADDLPLFVDESETNFAQVVKNNTDYLLHPEEILAENFSLWVVDGDIKHQEPIQRLLEVLKSIP